MADEPLAAVILAAGEGRRMRSERPKPLHRLCGRPMLMYAIDALEQVTVERIVVVVGPGGDRVAKTLHAEATGPSFEFVEQSVPRGTADALGTALTAFPDDDFDDGNLIVLPGDVPLLKPATIAALVAAHDKAGAVATVLTTVLDDPTNHTRVRRGKADKLVGLIDDGDLEPGADGEGPAEVSASIYCFRRGVLAPALRRVRPDNADGEEYLSDVIAVLHDAGYPLASFALGDGEQVAQVNDRTELAAVEAALRRRTNAGWLRRGVTMIDPDRTYIDVTVELAHDVTIFPGTMLQGSTIVGPGTEVGPDTRLVDCLVGAGARVEATSGVRATIGDHAVVGPFAALEPGSAIPAGARTGAFYTAQGSGEPVG